MIDHLLGEPYFNSNGISEFSWKYDSNFGPKTLTLSQLGRFYLAEGLYYKVIFSFYFHNEISGDLTLIDSNEELFEIIRQFASEMETYLLEDLAFRDAVPLSKFYLETPLNRIKISLKNPEPYLSDRNVLNLLIICRDRVKSRDHNLL